MVTELVESFLQLSSVVLFWTGPNLE